MSATLERKWSPHAAQRAIMNDDARFRVAAAGRRFGKTVMARHELFAAAWTNADSHFWWVGPSYTSVKDYGFEPMVEMIPEAIVADTSRQTPFSITLVNGTTISFRSADREDALRGAGLDGVVIDEAASVRTRAWQNELRPTLSDTLGWMLAIGTPKGESGWFYEWWQRGQDPDETDIRSWQFSTYENPFVPDSEVEAARAELPQFAFEQEYLAEFTRPAGLVYPAFDDTNITDEVPDNVRRVMYGVDWGFSSPAAVVCVIETRTDEFAVVDEVYADRLTIDDMASAIQGLHERWGAGTVYCDPAEPDSIESLQRAGIDAVQADNDILPGIQTVTALMDALSVHEGCDNLIRELNQYRYPDADDTENPSEKPLRVNDHAADALRYCLHTGSRSRPNIGVVSDTNLW